MEHQGAACQQSRLEFEHHAAVNAVGLRTQQLPLPCLASPMQGDRAQGGPFKIRMAALSLVQCITHKHFPPHRFSTCASQDQAQA